VYDLYDVYDVYVYVYYVVCRMSFVVCRIKPIPIPFLCHMLHVRFLAKACGKDLSMIERDTMRKNYLSPEEAVAYGLIDKVLYPEELRAQAPKFIDFL
jgi:hypothetical protein